MIRFLGLHSQCTCGKCLSAHWLHRTRKPHGLSKSIQIIAYYRQTYKAMHYINKSHAYKLATKTSKIKIKMKALSKWISICSMSKNELNKSILLRFTSATLWNELPNELRNVSSLGQFKSLINSWSGGSCRCGSCKSWRFILTHATYTYSFA